MGDKKVSVKHALLKKHECHGVTRREGNLKKHKIVLGDV